MSGDVEVILIFLLVKDDEEKIETRHNGGGDVHVVSKRFRAIVSASVGISSGQDRGTSVESGMDTSLGDRDGLLLHGLVNSNLILDIHLVELVNTADTVISEHESTSFDAELASLRVLANRSGQTGCV